MNKFTEYHANSIYQRSQEIMPSLYACKAMAAQLYQEPQGTFPKDISEDLNNSYKELSRALELTVNIFREQR